MSICYSRPFTFFIFLIDCGSVWRSTVIFFNIRFSLLSFQFNMRGLSLLFLHFYYPPRLSILLLLLCSPGLISLLFVSWFTSVSIKPPLPRTMKETFADYFHLICFLRSRFRRSLALPLPSKLLEEFCLALLRGCFNMSSLQAGDIWWFYLSAFVSCPTASTVVQMCVPVYLCDMISLWWDNEYALGRLARCIFTPCQDYMERNQGNTYEMFQRR